MDLVLAYSDKELHSHLRKKGVVVEMYATQWMTTLYTRVLELSLLYEVWEIFLFERDKFLIFYFAVGLMITFREKILGLQRME